MMLNENKRIPNDILKTKKRYIIWESREETQTNF